jgi:hypothetical protein
MCRVEVGQIAPGGKRIAELKLSPVRQHTVFASIFADDFVCPRVR